MITLKRLPLFQLVAFVVAVLIGFNAMQTYGSASWTKTQDNDTSGTPSTIEPVPPLIVVFFIGVAASLAAQYIYKKITEEPICKAKVIVWADGKYDPDSDECCEYRCTAHASESFDPWTTPCDSHGDADMTVTDKYDPGKREAYRIAGRGKAQRVGDPLKGCWAALDFWGWHEGKKVWSSNKPPPGDPLATLPMNETPQDSVLCYYSVTVESLSVLGFPRYPSLPDTFSDTLTMSFVGWSDSLPGFSINFGFEAVGQSDTTLITRTYGGLSPSDIDINAEAKSISICGWSVSDTFNVPLTASLPGGSQLANSTDDLGVADTAFFDLNAEVELRVRGVDVEKEFGDAPDPPYPSLAGSDGARHVIVTKEWLGDTVDTESDSRQVDKDQFDDGVRILGALKPNEDLRIIVTINTSGEAGRYDINNKDKVMYLNGWIDWGGDGSWDTPTDKVIGTLSPSGTQKFAEPTVVEYIVKVPPAVPESTWARFRLDYAEDVGHNPQEWTESTLIEEKGQANYGEVEDYPLYEYPPNKLEIEQLEPGVNPGETVDLRVFMKNPEEVGGFKFYVEYDPTVLTFLDVKRGEIIDDFDGYYDEYGHSPRYFFEYFQHRMLPCVQQCETYKIKVVGIADMPDGHEGERIAPRDSQEVLFYLTFKVANDANLKGVKTPVKWEWDDSICTENVKTDPTGTILYVSADTTQFNPHECDTTGPNTQIIRNIYFIDGGIRIRDDGLGWIGDININEYPYEIADAVLFSNYFLYGEDVFEDDPYWRDIQINATDVNQDGFVLSMSDFVFLIRIILEDISPKHKLTPSEDLVDVTLTTQGDAVKMVSNSNSTIGAGVYVFRHSGEVKNLITHTDMDVKYHAADGELRVLVYSFKGKSIPAGAAELFSFEAKDVELVQVEATDFYGSALKSTIKTKVLPTEFLLMNNYPNPFNLSTSIRFALPIDSDVSLKIYNIAGQLVRSFEGDYEAGSHAVTWDGTNTKGETVASGIYFYKLVVGDFTQTKKMIMLK